MGPIGSAVLTFIGYKHPNKQTDKPNLYIEEILNLGISPYYSKSICSVLSKIIPLFICIL